MELKKNPKKDLNKSSGVFFVAGLVMVLALTYVALEWKTFYGDTVYETAMTLDDELIEEVDLIQIEPPKPPIPPAAPEEIKVVEDDIEVKETIIESTESDEEIEVLEVGEVEYAEVEEEVKVNWVTIEEVPIFPGCEKENDKRACFNKMMQKHIRKVFQYPEIALEMGSEGKVFTQFTIQKDGSISKVRMHGPDKNLEKEAARIISKLPKMIPGKQRGNPVSVPFAIPINFVLQ